MELVEPELTPNQTLLLFIHIFTGVASLILGIWVLSRRKGDKLHKRLGRFYAGAMLTTSFTAFSMAVVSGDDFLLAVSIFSFYLTASGYRYIYLMRMQEEMKPAIPDYAVTGFMLATAFYFLTNGLKKMVAIDIFGAVYVIFALISFMYVIKDFQNYRLKRSVPNEWIIQHLQRMIAAYISTITAFIVVNASHSPFPIPDVVYWLLPTIILAPVIRRISKKLRKKPFPIVFEVEKPKRKSWMLPKKKAVDNNEDQPPKVT